MTSPQPLRKDSQLSSVALQETDSVAIGRHGTSAGRPPKIPSFLDLPEHEIDNKFQEIVWMERNRLAQSVANPSPDFRWARVTGDHLKKLDRYMNIQPWENNRVKLGVPAGRQDYINASPVTLTSIAPAATHPQSSVKSSKCKKEDTIVGLSDLAGGAPDRYIAMQGPKSKTTSHVWRMVVEQLDSPGVIVMLTETHEANMEKCYPYFPRSSEDPPLQVNPKDEFGDGFRATVRCEAIEETEAGEAIELRKLVVRVFKNATQDAAFNANRRSSGEGPPTPEHSIDENGDVKMLSPKKSSAGDEPSIDDVEDDADSVTVEFNRPPRDPGDISSTSQDLHSESPEDEYEERVVWHFLYKKWPDFGVPALEDLDSFFTLMRLSRQKNANPSNPRIVHCSAGVGRSGTFIALEHLMREMDAGVLDDWDSPSHFRHGQKDGVNDVSSMDGHNGHVEKAESNDAEALKMDVEEDKGTTLIEGDDLIFHTVNQLREQRRNMVQADSQFLFLYQVLRKLWEERHGISITSITSSEAPQLPDLAYSSNNGEPAAKRLEFDPFIEQE